MGIVRIVLILLLIAIPVAAEDPYISGRDTLERLVRLEMEVQLRFREIEKAIELAKDNEDSRRIDAKLSNDARLESMNEFRQQMNRAEGTYATKVEHSALERLVYIGIGILMAVQALIDFVITRNEK